MARNARSFCAACAESVATIAIRLLKWARPVCVVKATNVIVEIPSAREHRA